MKVFPSKNDAEKQNETRNEDDLRQQVFKLAAQGSEASSTFLEIFRHNILLFWSLRGTIVRTGLLLLFVLWLRLRMQVDEVSVAWRLFAFMTIQMFCWSLSAIECVRSADLNMRIKLSGAFAWFSVTLGIAGPLYYWIDMDLTKWGVWKISLAQMVPYSIGLMAMFSVTICGQENGSSSICSLKVIFMLVGMGISMSVFILNLEYYFIGGILMRNQPVYLEMLYTGILPLMQSASSRVVFVHFMAKAVSTIVKIRNVNHLEHFYIRNVKFCLKLPTIVTVGLMSSWLTFTMAILLSMALEFVGILLNYLVYVRTPESSVIGKRLFQNQSQEERKFIYVRYFSEEEYAEKIIILSAIFISFGFNATSSSQILVALLCRSLILIVLEVLEDMAKQKIVENLTGISICKAFPVDNHLDLKESIGATLLVTAPAAMLIMGEDLSYLL